jgi:hypothetical protein
MRNCPFCKAEYSENTDCCGQEECLEKLVNRIPAYSKQPGNHAPTQVIVAKKSTIGDGMRFGFGFVVVVILVVIVLAAFFFIV